MKVERIQVPTSIYQRPRALDGSHREVQGEDAVVFEPEEHARQEGQQRQDPRKRQQAQADALTPEVQTAPETQSEEAPAVVSGTEKVEKKPLLNVVV